MLDLIDFCLLKIYIQHVLISLVRDNGMFITLAINFVGCLWWNYFLVPILRLEWTCFIILLAFITLPLITSLIVVGAKCLSVSSPFLLIYAFAIAWSKCLLSNRKNEWVKISSALTFTCRFDETYLDLSSINFLV